VRVAVIRSEQVVSSARACCRAWQEPSFFYRAFLGQELTKGDGRRGGIRRSALSRMQRRERAGMASTLSPSRTRT